MTMAALWGARIANKSISCHFYASVYREYR